MDFRILGSLEVILDGDEFDVGPPLQRALLSRLLINPSGTVSTDRLIDDLWPESPPETARHALHVYVSRLRTGLGTYRDRLQREGSGYRLNLEPAELDASRFAELVDAGRAARDEGKPERARELLRTALQQWRGPALADVSDHIFARTEITRLEEMRLGALEERIWADLDSGMGGELVAELREIVAQHALNEGFWEQLMLALYRSGRQAEALRVFQTARSKLAEDLGIEPGPALRQMEDRILTQDPTLDMASTVRSHAPPRIPPARTSFVGRHGELREVEKLLANVRLLTLTGPPGSGKTRLATEFAARMEDEFPDGTHFVPLATLSDAALLDQEIARVLQTHHDAVAAPAVAIAQHLGGRRSLLVLDNFEQILAAAPRVGAILDLASEVKVLVTSRAPLGISGEQEFPVPPLRAPPTDIKTDLIELVGFDAVALFVARAKAADPAFELTADNVDSIRQIVNRLDGLPLAIELAAARVKLLPPHDLATRLVAGLSVLTAGPADASDRHRTMRDAIAWSYELLDSAEQGLFGSLAVFRGGFTIEAAAEVAGVTVDVAISLLGSLLNNSLIYRVVNANPARLSMLELVREFASEKLDEAQEASDMAGRHADFFLGLVAELVKTVADEPSRAAAARLAFEVENVRHALEYALEAGKPDLGLQLASRFWRVWHSTERLTEGRDWLRRLLQDPDASRPARASGLSALAGIAYWQADYSLALERYAEALEIYRADADRASEADTLYSMSLTANWDHDLDQGQRLADAARSIYEDIGSREGVGKAMMAEAFVLWRRGELVAAKDLWQQSLAISRESGDDTLAVSQLVGLASLTYHLGDREEALRLVIAGVSEARELGNDHLTVWLLDFVAAFGAQDAPEIAVRLAGAVDALRHEAGGGMLPESIDVPAASTVAAAHLAPNEIERAWTEGSALDLDAALEQARLLEGRQGDE